MLRSTLSCARQSIRTRRQSGPRVLTPFVILIALLLTSQVWPQAVNAPSSLDVLERVKPEMSADQDAHLREQMKMSAGEGKNEVNPFEMTTLNTPSKSSDGAKPFDAALRKALKKRKMKLENVCAPDNLMARRVLADYGAMFLADKKVLPPPVCVFADEDAVTQFQNQARYTAAIINDVEIELQPAAMEAFLKAREAALKENLNITPRDEDAARRSYNETLELWGTRVNPALAYWQEQGRLTAEQAQRLRALPLQAQVTEVLTLEQSGIFFSKDLTKSILYSVAAPGTSQHLSMLAIDVDEFADVRVRAILAAHGWFQTVLSDLPHFTFLGLKEKDLPSHGLRPVTVDNQVFWIPNLEEMNQ